MTSNIENMRDIPFKKLLTLATFLEMVTAGSKETTVGRSTYQQN
jgi:hypothetical protein